MSAGSTPPAVCAKCGETHDPTKCQAHAKSSGKQCRRAPLHGATVCIKHGAAAPQVANAAARVVAFDRAVRELRLGGRLEGVDPAEAMLEQVREAAANVEVYRYLVSLLRAEVQDGDELGALESDDEDGPSMEDIDRSELGGTIAGRVDPGNWKAAPHVYVVMYDEERERLMRFAKMCRDAGVEEHRVLVAERMATQLVEAQTAVISAVLGSVRRLLDQGGLTVAGLGRLEREEVPRLIRGVIEARLSGERAS